MSRVARAGKEASSAAGSAYSWLCARLRCVRLGSTPSYSPPHLGKYFGKSPRVQIRWSNKFALLWGEAQKKIAYSYPRVT